MSEYKPPSWAGKPPPGLHLDVVKNGTVLQKLLIDEKSYYLFGRNKDVCDFTLEHQSASRLHAALVYHKHLDRPFLVDLGSTHGTFVGSMRLEHDKPQQIPIDITISFGASTRTYTLRKRPQAIHAVTSSLQDGDQAGESLSGLLGLPESETEMDDLTQYNTAHNRQISTVGIAEEDNRPKKRKKRLSSSVNFNNDIDVINPEDVDPSVGRFRNMIQTSFIPSSKRQKTSKDPFPTSPTDTVSPTSKQKRYELPKPSLYDDIPGSEIAQQISPSAIKGSSDPLSPLFTTRTISAAPPVQSPTERQLPSLPAVPMNTQPQNVALSTVTTIPMFGGDTEPQKKKYAKEAWPGKRPTPLLL
ncbi:nuclear inhibitor of protein phosphatase 1-like [Dysidea avara]|uniref:nuclear inhibitor of protein phosphatase 1-like n=1 Tax=Dysidea avara TaxID=196820 RepID=UPI00331AC7FD